MNSGNKHEEKLKLITLAYTQLKHTYRKKLTPNINSQPDIKISIKQTFGYKSNMEVNAFQKSEYVPDIDKNYKFDRDTTLAIISGFAFNKRVLVQGYHGTGSQLILNKLLQIKLAVHKN